MLLADAASGAPADSLSDILAIVALVIASVAALITLGIAVFNYLAVREMKRGTKASVLQKCTENYIIIRRHKARAIIEKSRVLAEDYYRAICDLYWSEFRLYVEGLIPTAIMEAWLYARKRDFADGKIEFEDGAGNITTVSCKDVWHRLVADGYFVNTDPFVTFMDHAHRDKVGEALAIRAQGS